MINHQIIATNRIFKLLDSIEDKTKTMAHEIPEIKGRLEQWQNGELKTIYFLNTLTKLVDELNKGK